jgi:hypothetical protein
LGDLLLVGAAGTRAVIEVELLCDVAARRLAPGDIESGRSRIEALAKPLRRRLTAINLSRSVIGSLGAVVAVAGFAFVVSSPSHSGDWFAQSLTVGGAAVAMMSWLSGRLIQQRKRFFTNRPYDIPLPPEIEQLLADLASGRLRAVMSKGYGPVSTSALRATDGQLFDTEIAPGTFANRFAPILLLPDPKAFSALWMPWGRTLDRPIYVVREPADQSEGEAPCLNHDPRDQWLVGGALRDFERGRDSFIAAKIPDHNAEWFRLVLTVGRREMRKGRQHGAQIRAIAVIQQELGNKLGPRGGESQHLIKQLLQGRHGDSDIKGYFAPTKG